MKLSKSEFAVILCDLHRLQKAVEFERAFENWNESEKQEVYFSNQLLGLFIYRIQRDPGFAWHILFRVCDNEQTLQQTLQYINTLWDIWGEGLNDLYTFPAPSFHASSRRFETLRDEVWRKFQRSQYICPFGCTANEVFLLEYCVEADVSSEIYRSARYLQIHNAPQGDANLFTYFDPLGSKPLEREWKQYLLKNIQYPRYYTSDKQYYCQNEMPYLPALRRRFAKAFGFGIPDEAWLEAEWAPSIEKNPYSEEQRFEQLQNLVFTTSALMIAAEVWFRDLRCEEQVSLLNQEYPWPSKDEIVRREVPAVLRSLYWHPQYQRITSSPAASLDLRGPEIMDAITLIESGRENDGNFLLISWFAGDSRNRILHNIRQIGYAFLAHGLNQEKIFPQLCDVLITSVRHLMDQEIADLFAEFCLYSCGEEWFIRQSSHGFRIYEKADWYLGRAKLAYAAGGYEKARTLCQNAIDAVEELKLKKYWTNLPDCYLLKADIYDAEGDLRGRHSCLYQYICSSKRILETYCTDSDKKRIMSFIQLDDLLSRTPLCYEAIIDTDDAKKAFRTAEYIQNSFREEGENTNIDYSMPFGWIGKGVEILINTKVLIPAREQIRNELLCECNKSDFPGWWKRFFYDAQTLSCGTFSNFILNGEITEEKSNPIMSEFCQNVLSTYSRETLREMAVIANKIADYRNPATHHAIFTKEEMNREWGQASLLANELIHLIYPIPEKQSEKRNTPTLLHQKDPDNPVVSRSLEIQKRLIDKSGD